MMIKTNHMQNFGGQKCRKSGLLPKILSAENFCPPKILSAEILSDKVRELILIPSRKSNLIFFAVYTDMNFDTIHESRALLKIYLLQKLHDPFQSILDLFPIIFLVHWSRHFRRVGWNQFFRTIGRLSPRFLELKREVRDLEKVSPRLCKIYRVDKFSRIFAQNLNFRDIARK